MKKLALWQLVTTVLALSIFFVVRHFIADKEIVAYIVVISMVPIMVYSILSCNLAALAASVATLSVIAAVMDATWTAFFVPTMVLVTICMVNMGIAKKKVFVMYGMQFAIVFIPIFAA